MEKIAFSRPYFGPEEEAACARVIRSRWVVGGAEQASFEERFAALCDAPHAVAVSSWTTAAFLVLKAWGLGPGDEVIVPSSTFIASVNVVRHAGAQPIFADVDPKTWNIDPQDILRRITARTKAIIPVDQIGMPAEMDEILRIAREHGLLVLHDAACSFGSTYRDRPVGAISDVSCFSLHARKVITTGEGGVVVCRDEEFASRLRRLRHQGMSISDHERHRLRPTHFEAYPEIGYNYRFTDIQAAIGNIQLDRLSDILSRRRLIAERYIERLRDHEFLQLPHEPPHCRTNWQSFQILVKDGAFVGRNALMDALWERGIPTRRGVMASHLEPPYAKSALSLPNTESIAAQGLQLPMYPELDPVQQSYVIDCLLDLMSASAGGASGGQRARR